MLRKYPRAVLGATPSVLFLGMTFLHEWSLNGGCFAVSSAWVLIGKRGSVLLQCLPDGCLGRTPEILEMQSCFPGQYEIYKAKKGIKDDKSLCWTNHHVLSHPSSFFGVRFMVQRTYIIWHIHLHHFYVGMGQIWYEYSAPKFSLLDNSVGYFSLQHPLFHRLNQNSTIITWSNDWW